MGLLHMSDETRFRLSLISIPICIAGLALSCSTYRAAVARDRETLKGPATIDTSLEFARIEALDEVMKWERDGLSTGDFDNHDWTYSTSFDPTFQDRLAKELLSNGWRERVDWELKNGKFQKRRLFTKRLRDSYPVDIYIAMNQIQTDGLVKDLEGGEDVWHIEHAPDRFE